MRAALAELDEYAHVEVFDVAVRAAHDAMCDCDSDRCRDQVKRPTRSELVAAHRALHALARRGMVTLSRWQFYLHEAPPVLIAKRCQVGKSSESATHTGDRRENAA
jgi:hypothetical protein